MFESQRNQALDAAEIAIALDPQERREGEKQEEEQSRLQLMKYQMEKTQGGEARRNWNWTTRRRMTRMKRSQLKHIDPPRRKKPNNLSER